MKGHGLRTFTETKEKHGVNMVPHVHQPEAYGLCLYKSCGDVGLQAIKTSLKPQQTSGWETSHRPPSVPPRAPHLITHVLKKLYPGELLRKC